MKISFEWEKIDFIRENNIRTWKAKVIGGWIIRTETWSELGSSESMVFVNDPNHEWEVPEVN